MRSLLNCKMLILAIVSGATSSKLSNNEWRWGHIVLMTMQLHLKFRDGKEFV